jgi:hypothetical protein
MNYRLLVAALLSVAAGMVAQPNMQRDSSVAVTISGTPLKFPWAGGHNFTNWGMIDLNGDGFKDLVSYDRSGGKIRTYLNDKLAGQPSFTHSPYFQNNWPAISSWLALYDYNCDGREDIFTYANGAGAILVYKNISSGGNFQFTPVGHYDTSLGAYFLISDYSPLGIPGSYNIPANQVGLPGIGDMDADGDLDIIVFNAQGYNIEYHQNQSEELGYGCDSLLFKAVDNCWGDINEGSCGVNLNVCPFPKVVQQVQQAVQKNQHHAGSCIMCFDADGDTLPDVLLGDVVCDSIVYLHNGGMVNNAHIDVNTSQYPPAKPVGMSIFPCTYYLDLDNDGKRDLLAAPALQGSQNVNNTWLYLNTGADNSPVLAYVKNSFLQENMIDLGEGAYPTFFDEDADGDLDLLVGNFGYFGSPYSSRLALFRNTGSTIAPSFSLVTSDYSALSVNGMLNMAPAMADLDGDGDQDLLIGDNGGRFSFFTNTGGPGNPAAFSATATSNFGNGFLAGMDVGVRAYPQVVDLDKDGRLDIIAGNQAGKVYYYQNTGTVTAPSFTLVTNALGGVNVLQGLCSSLGQAMPFVFSDNGTYKMLVGSDCGNLFLYDNIDGNLGGTFSLLSANAFGLAEGGHTAPALYDLTGDGRLDLVLGNYSGGLGFFRGLSTNFGIQEDALAPECNMYPNPASGSLTLQFNSFDVAPKQVFISEISGRRVLAANTKDNVLYLQVGELPAGIYFVGVNEPGRAQMIKKLVVSHE